MGRRRAGQMSVHSPVCRASGNIGSMADPKKQPAGWSRPHRAVAITLRENAASAPELRPSRATQLFGKCRCCMQVRAPFALKLRPKLAARRGGRKTALARSHLTISNSPSRSRGAFLRPGFCLFASLTPKEGVAERRETYGCLRGIRWACTIGAGQAPSEAPCVPIRGTPASRRSHRGDFGRRGRASPHRHCGRIGHSELPHPGRSARRGAPASRGDGCESPPRDATPRSVLRMPPDDAPRRARLRRFLLHVAKCSQLENSICSDKIPRPADGSQQGEYGRNPKYLVSIRRIFCSATSRE
jgi:hypothetical protein